ncbi:alpha,alpha-trehalase [Nematocida sp. LUAm3]|nr:alpha,alpha-trehalase [Nematocida sp. LUAm3]KAI5176198.1 alpha,alpha-trehalase [Nematocida sp. LUAm2]KAI5179186.1 alpha,alpha-trehalase [Nematocida sp. LUAm1]
MEVFHNMKKKSVVYVSVLVGVVLFGMCSLTEKEELPSSAVSSVDGSTGMGGDRGEDFSEEEELKAFAMGLPDIPRIYKDPTTREVWSMFVGLMLYVEKQDQKSVADSVALKATEELLEEYKRISNLLNKKESINKFYKESFKPVNIKDYVDEEHAPAPFTGSEEKEQISHKEMKENTKKELPNNPIKTSKKYQELLDRIYVLWNLFKKEIPLESEEKFLNSLIPLNGPFVAPGGRFQEMYYWDAYWINKGLILSRKNDLQELNKKNFIQLINEFSFIPNGSRWYYSTRSQPPFFLSLLVDSISSIDYIKGKLNTTKKAIETDGSYIQVNPEVQSKRADAEENSISIESISQPSILSHLSDLSKYNLSISDEELISAEKEYIFWKKNRTITINGKDPNKKYTLHRYRVDENVPRPEMLQADLSDALLYKKNTGNSPNAHFFRDIATAAETGWDFSTRWREYHKPCNKECHDNCEKQENQKNCHKKGTYGYLITSQYVPVDLNSILLRNLRILEAIYKKKEDKEKEEIYRKDAKQLAEAMDALLWDNTHKRWRDLLLSEEKGVIYAKHREDRVFYLSDLYPLFLELVSDPNNKIFNKCKSFIWPHNYSYLPYTSTVIWKEKETQPTKREQEKEESSAFSSKTSKTNDQWDGNNIWPPLTQLLIEYLIVSEQKELAILCASNFISEINNYYKQYKHIPEKIILSKKKSTGEYATQNGFGWTNAVVQWIAYVFEDQLKTQ